MHFILLYWSADSHSSFDAYVHWFNIKLYSKNIQHFSPGFLRFVSNIPNQYVFLSTRQSSSELHDLLLNDSTLLPLDINLQLFNIVEEYIVNSQRFDS